MKMGAAVNWYVSSIATLTSFAQSRLLNIHDIMTRNSRDLLKFTLNYGHK